MSALLATNAAPLTDDSPWALALGTPVLVIAGLLHMCYYCTRAHCKKLYRKSKSEAETEPPMSRVYVKN